MIPSTQELSDLLGALYDAAGDPELWTPFLQTLARSTGAQSALLLMHSAGQDVYTVSRSWEFDPQAIQAYQDYYCAFDIWARRGFSKPAGTVCNSEQLCSRTEIESTEFYNDLLNRCGIEYGMFGVIESSPSRWASVSLFRGNSESEFQLDDLETLRFVTPHIRRAFQLHFQFSDVKTRSADSEKALDCLPIGVVFFGVRGEILYMNRTASGIVFQRDGLLAMRDGIRAEKQNESDLLAQTILRAVSKANGVELPERVVIEVSRQSRPSLQVVISPIRDRAIDASQRAAAVAFIHDPLQCQSPAQGALRRRYGLTPAESRVALLLAEGRAPREIAEILKVSFNTVRSQIQSVFQKTGVRRQGELIRLLIHHA